MVPCKAVSRYLPSIMQMLKQPSLDVISTLQIIFLVFYQKGICLKGKMFVCHHVILEPYDQQ